MNNNKKQPNTVVNYKPFFKNNYRYMYSTAYHFGCYSILSTTAIFNAPTMADSLRKDDCHELNCVTEASTLDYTLVSLVSARSLALRCFSHELNT
jgi:hypothetical protein